ncbi:beta-1,3-galactosyltransferase 5-like isoform X2 [Protopterus annectens]|uniref:beta-1,3-galactosyltransferase 5-like isoform X2 n=1 Tax=Protopterus annectens TaxID=7888 RepID=UPI001CF9AF68|nr:beta-1,3-galactosyltransferase 5-like isoform X2 [Protopterus annectens]
MVSSINEMLQFILQRKTLNFLILLVLLFLCIVILWYTWQVPSYRPLVLYSHQVTKRFQKTDFLLTPETDCMVDPPYLVILVSTTHDQLKARAAVRKTWGKIRLIQNKTVVTYFLIGTTESHVHQDTLANENAQHGDIIQKNFLDTYHNLTLKTLMGIEWVSLFCSSSSFVMKTDSDMFINVFYLVDLLLKKDKKTNFFTGFIKLNERPLRDTSSKWYVSEAEYPEKTYPPFCSGTGYVFSADLAQKIYNASRHVPVVNLEDVYVGLCLSKLNITPEPLTTKNVFFSHRIQFSVCSFRNIVTTHRFKPSEILLYWRALEESMDAECKSDDGLS